MASPLRLNAALYEAAEKEGARQKRSIPKQVEYWAELGIAVERELNLDDIQAIRRGFKKIVVEPVTSVAVDSNEVFDSLEINRKNGSLSEKVTTSVVYYEASLSQPGLLDRVNVSTGERQTGRFHNGEFKKQI